MLWVSCLSRFLLFLPDCRRQAGFLYSRQISNGCCTRPSLRSGCAHLHTIKILYTLTVFRLRSTLYPMTFAALSQGLRRDTAAVPATKFVTGDKFSAPIKLVPPLLICKSGAGAPHLVLTKICTHDARLRLGQGRPGRQKVRHTLLAT